MKFDWNKRYTTISIYAVVVFLICYSIYKFTNNWQSTSDTILHLVGILAPFIYALIIAYFIDPLIMVMESSILKKVVKLSVRRSLSILLSYILIITAIVVLLSFVIPQLASSLSEIRKLPDLYIPFAQEWLSRERLQIFDTGYYLDLTIINRFLNENIMTTFSSISDILTNFAPILLEFVAGFTSGLLNVLLGFIIAIYLLSSKERGLLNARKVVFALLPAKKAVNFINLSKESNEIFINFITGKMLDSLIIGLLSFVILLIFNYPYALLISVIIGITNMIPYFGPFIGGGIGFALLVFSDPTKSLWFILFIIILQQFDGNILGPKILGDSTGLSPFWVIFAILLFGSFFGFPGMFFGVPILAVIKNIVARQIDTLYKKKTTHM